MDNLLAKRGVIFMFGMLFFSTVSFSQVDNFEFLRAGAYDASLITQYYVAPWANAFGAGVNGNWYNTAKPHKFGGFDITIGANVGFVPSSDNSFDVSKIGLKTFSGTGLAPTISGISDPGPTLTSAPVSGIAPVTFRTPEGTNWQYMPVPSLQAGIGLPLGSEVKIRYIPKVPIGEGDFSSWGVGLLHSIMQYLPGDKIFPFDISLFGGYTILNGNAPIDLKPGTPQFYSSKYPSSSWDNQNFNIVTEAWNASVIGSINLRIITFYGGLGYSNTNTKINMTGYYPMPTVNRALSSTSYVYEDAGVLNGFPLIEMKNFSGVRTNIGFRLKFAIITFHADYTWANYSVFSTGLGVSFR